MRTLLLCTALLAALGACKSRDTPSGMQAAEYGAPQVAGHLFVGCIRDQGECFNSCADHQILNNGDQPSAYCREEGRLFECHCKVGDDVTPEAPPY